MPPVNGVGEPGAGEPHARIEVAGAGNGAKNRVKAAGVAQPTGKPAEHEGPRTYHTGDATAPVPDPTRGAGREVTDGDLQAGLGGEVGQTGLEQAVAVPVGPPGVRGDQQAAGGGVGAGAHRGPPGPDAVDREVPGVGGHPHADPALVPGQVVDPVGDGLGQVRVGEVVVQGPDRVPGRAPGHARVVVPAHHLLLLRVHADHRIPCRLEGGHQVGQVPELGVPVRVPGALQRLGDPLQAVPHRLQHAPDHRVGAGEPGPDQFPGQGAGRPRRPPQRAHRVPPRPGLHQRVQRLGDPRLGHLHRRTSRPRPTDTVRDLRPGLHLPPAPPHHVQRRPRRPRDRGRAPMTQDLRERTPGQPPLPLVQMRRHQLEELADIILGHHESHTGNLTGHHARSGTDTPETMAQQN
jgi:hypothetical protein